MKKLVLFIAVLTVMCANVKSQIVYTDFESSPTILDANHIEYEFHFNGTIPEFIIQNYYAISPQEVTFFGCFTEGSEVVSTSAEYNANVNLLTENTMIDGTLTYFGSTDGAPYFNVLLSSDYQALVGKTGYVGFRFKIGNSIHYGWAKISVTLTAITLYGYAYQSKPNTPIKAGDKGLSSLEEMVKNSESNTEITLFPNPTSSFLMVNYSKKVEKVEIINILGQTVLSEKANTNVIDLSSLDNGIYYVSIITEGETIVKKFVKQ
ncbi:MAG: T9SS type A sorting domain-containing protein [Bacteroidales bacterium]